MVRQTPDISILQVQAEAIWWVQEVRPNDCKRGRSYSVPSMCGLQQS